jgi:hypothetical protein
MAPVAPVTMMRMMVLLRLGSPDVNPATSSIDGVGGGVLAAV